MIRILLAEDDEAMRSYLARALTRAGYRVVAAADGLEALEVLARDWFDLLLSDVVMPGMDGIELARQCERLRPGTKIMFITGFAAVALKDDRTMPRAAVMSKPFHLRELVLEINRLFGLDTMADG